jgi:hypothetical protein
VASTTCCENHAQWNTIDETRKPYRYPGRGNRMIGSAGPANTRAGDVYSKRVITDMFPKGVPGAKPEENGRWAEGEWEKVYEW